MLRPAPNRYVLRSVALDAHTDHSQETIKYLAVLVTVVELLLLACSFEVYRIARNIRKKLEDTFN